MINYGISETINYSNASFKNETNYDIISSNEIKEDKNLSLVGLLICKDGIVGIGDYKSTKSFYGGIKYKENRKTQKIFVNNKFIMATIGTNIIDKDGSREKLEDFINRTLDDDMDYRYFFNHFANYANNANYNFFIGTKLLSGEYVLYEIKCSKGKIEEYPIFDNPVFAGDSSYYEILKYIPINYSEMNVEEASAKLKSVFIKLIDLKNESTEYCSVGLEGETEPLTKTFK